MKIKRSTWLLAALSSITALCSLNAYLLWPREFTHSVVLFAMLAALMWLSLRIWTENDKRLRRYAWIFGLLFSLAQVCGSRLDAAGSIFDAEGISKPALLLLLSTVGLTPSMSGMFCLLAGFLDHCVRCAAPQQRWSSRRIMWSCAFLMLLCWLPIFLAYYPGIYSYDVSRQIQQIVTGDYNDHNPIAHTLLVGLFYQLGAWLNNPNLGIALYIGFQMIVMALVMSYSLSVLYREGCARWVLVITLLLCCLSPFHSLLVTATTKDVLFAGASLYWGMMLVQGWRHSELWKKRGWMLRYLLSIIIVSLLRTNGLLLVAGVLIAGLIVLRHFKEIRKRFLALTLCGLLGYFGVHEGLTAAYNAEPGPFHEVLNIPIQQIARVHEILPRESREEMRYWMPDVALYQPALTDYVKHTADINPEDLPEFLGLWARLGIKYPTIYLDAFGFLTKGYWQVDDMTHATFRGELLEYHEGYLGTIFRTSWGVTFDSKLPALYDWLEQMFSVNKYLNIPLFSALMSTGLWCWMMLALFLYAMVRKRRDAILLVSGFLALYVGLYLGPCCTVRYVYPFMLCVPALLGVLTISSREN